MKDLFEGGGKKAAAKSLPVLFALAIALITVSCGKKDAGVSSGPAAANPAELKFMFWGSLVEKAAVEKCTGDYNRLNQGKIHVTAQHVPDDYSNKLATMIAGGTPPDVGYLSAGLGPTYAKEGKLIFVEDLLGDDKSFLNGVLPGAQWKVNGRVAFFSTAMETLLITYNRDLFDQRKVPYPPAKFEEALKWDDFIDLCRRMTFDANGNDAKSPNFDPSRIETYGLSITTYLYHILLLVASNGGSVLNADDSNTAFDSPAWIDTMNKINDLIYKYHVVPTPAAQDALAAEAMLTGQIAMTCDGNWSFLDYQDQGLNVGCAVFPDLGRGPFSMSAPGVTAVFAGTQYAQEAWDFYKFSLDAEKGPADLFKNGLWQPVYNEFYTDPARIAFWVDTPAHPPEYRDVVVANINRNIIPIPPSYVNRWGDVAAILNPAIQEIFGKAGDAGPILRAAQATVDSSGAYTGRIDR